MIESVVDEKGIFVEVCYFSAGHFEEGDDIGLLEFGLDPGVVGIFEVLFFDLHEVAGFEGNEMSLNALLGPDMLIELRIGWLN